MSISTNSPSIQIVRTTDINAYFAFEKILPAQDIHLVMLLTKGSESRQQVLTYAYIFGSLGVLLLHVESFD